MKKFNKFLALGLAGASLLTGGLMLSGCNITQNNDNTQIGQEQEGQKVVSSISINADTLPRYIIKGKFARTDIKATVTYEDNSTKVIDVTESMFSEADRAKLNSVSQYNLTINYGGKTATMYANVVDERYLLKEVVEANLDKDVTLICGTNMIQIDADNGIMKEVSETEVIYTWLSNNTAYQYDLNSGYTKRLSRDYTNDSEMYRTFMILDILEDGTGACTIESIEQVEQNYILIVQYSDEGSITYTFNDDFLLGVKLCSDEEETIYSYNYSPITLEVPSEIKALENTAIIDIGSRIAVLRYDVMESYLKSDFEMLINGESYAKYDADNQVLCTTEDGEQVWMWLNGDYCYTHHNGESQLAKHNASEWESRLKSYLFTEDALNESSFEHACTISADGQYYEITVTTNDENNTIYKYTFNDDEISKIEISSDLETIIATYVKKSINLEVPAEIKALENSAQ